MSANVRELTAESFDREVAGGTVLVKFGTEWCPPCRTVAPVIDGIANEFVGTVKVFTVDTERSPELAAKFRIEAIPTLVILKEGEVEFRYTGVLSKRVLVEKLGLAA